MDFLNPMNYVSPHANQATPEHIPETNFRRFVAFGMKESCFEDGSWTPKRPRSDTVKFRDMFITVLTHAICSPNYYPYKEKINVGDVEICWEYVGIEETTNRIGLSLFCQDSQEFIWLESEAINNIENCLLTLTEAMEINVPFLKLIQ